MPRVANTACQEQYVAENVTTAVLLQDGNWLYLVMEYLPGGDVMVNLLCQIQLYLPVTECLNMAVWQPYIAAQ